MRIGALSVDPDVRNGLNCWEAMPYHRFERLLRETCVLAGLLISEQDGRRDSEVQYYPNF
jgi:hypothetical protein